MVKQVKLSRRRFLELAAMSAAGAFLAACGTKEAPGEEAPQEGAAPAETKEVKIARCGWLESEMPFDLAIATYNNLEERQTDHVQIILDPAGKAATDQVLAGHLAGDGSAL